MDDADAIVGIKLRALEERATNHYDESQLSALAPREAAATSHSLLGGKFREYVAVEDEEVIGYAVAHVEEARIHGVYVAPERAREGIGRELVQRLENVLREEVDELDVLSALNAVGFYESLGYEPVEETAIDADGVDIPVVRMERPI